MYSCFTLVSFTASHIEAASNISREIAIPGQFSDDERLEGAVIGGMAVTVLLLIALITLCVIRRCINVLPANKTAPGWSHLFNNMMIANKISPVI